MPPRCRYSGPLGEIRAILVFRFDPIVCMTVFVESTYRPRLTGQQAEYCRRAFDNSDEPLGDFDADQGNQWDRLFFRCSIECVCGCLVSGREVLSHSSMQAEVPVVPKPVDCWKSPHVAGLFRAVVPLRHPADWRSLAFLILFVCLAGVQWLGWFRHWSLLVLACVLAFVACIIKHNHIHCRTFA